MSDLLYLQIAFGAAIEDLSCQVAGVKRVLQSVITDDPNLILKRNKQATEKTSAPKKAEFKGTLLSTYDHDELPVHAAWNEWTNSTNDRRSLSQIIKQKQGRRFTDRASNECAKKLRYVCTCVELLLLSGEDEETAVTKLETFKHSQCLSMDALAKKIADELSKNNLTRPRKMTKAADVFAMPQYELADVFWKTL